MLLNNKNIVSVSLVLSRLYLDDSEYILNEKWKEIRTAFIDIKNEKLLYNELIQFLSRNRVLEIVLTNCKKINDIVLEDFIKDIQNQKLKNRENVKPEILKNIPDILNNDNILFIKGSVISQLYPLNYSRYQVDVDIIIKNIDELWNMLNQIKGVYKFDRLKIYTSSKNRISASIDLEPISKELPYIDIHVSPFEIWGSINYDSDLWKKNIKVDGKILIPSKEDMLILLCAHLAKQWMYRIRDINDCYIILKNYKLDWNYIYTQCKKFNLFTLLVILIKNVESVYGLTIDDERFSKKFSFFENLFIKHNLGKQRVYTSFGLEFKFVYQYYYLNIGMYQAIKNSIKNTKNLIVYKNRAYKINKKRKIKQLKENEIIVLVPTKKIFNIVNKRKLLDTSMYIVNEGMKNEYFETPYCNWIQSTYYVKK